MVMQQNFVIVCYLSKQRLQGILMPNARWSDIAKYGKPIGWCGFYRAGDYSLLRMSTIEPRRVATILRQRTAFSSLCSSPLFQTVSYAAVRSMNTTPVFSCSWKPDSMWLARVSTCSPQLRFLQNPACSADSNFSMSEAYICVAS